MLDDYRCDFEEFHTSNAREHYLFHSGQKNRLEIAPIYERYGHLFDRDSIERLERELGLSELAGLETVSINRLLAFAVEQFLESSVKELTEQISQFEATATVEFMGRDMTFQDSAVAIITEHDRDSRKAIYDRRLVLIDASNELRAQRIVKLHETACSLGYSSYRELFEKLRRLDYKEVARRCEGFLSQTEPAYSSRLDEVLSHDLGLSIDEAERPDAMYLLHLTNFDDRFPSRQMLRVYSATMAGLGISVGAQRNIAIDSEARPRKNPRAFCMPITIPDDVRLVIRPVGGQSDYQSLLHESGHAQHFAWASAELPPEFKYTGDYALTETYAFLFNHLVSDRNWLKDFLGLTDPTEFVLSVMLARLVTVRRYVAKLCYERQLHSAGDLTGQAQQYASLQTNSTRFKTSAAEFLFDLDDSFYSASYLRAWAFEVLLREYVKTRFGSRWWASPRAGAFLKDIWQTGDRYTADEMAAQIGIGTIDFEPLADEFNSALK
jgi:hypothetical protein